MSDPKTQPGFIQLLTGALSRITTRTDESVESAPMTPPPVVCDLLTLEDRVLYSAAPVPVDLIGQVDAIENSIDDVELWGFESTDADWFAGTDNLYESSPWLGEEFEVGLDSESTDERVEEVTVSPEVISQELVVIDRSVSDYATLVDDLMRADAGRGNRAFDVIYLETDESGVASLTRQLGGLSKTYSAIHVVSHGTDGTILLGNDRLDASNVGQFGDALSQWSQYLSVDADLLIYGCDVASNADGQTLIDAMADLTGADVAASDDVTGYSELGGDWNFEYSTGFTESELAFSMDVRQNWNQSLAELSRESGGPASFIGTDDSNRIVIAFANDEGTGTGLDIYHVVVGGGSAVLVNDTVAGDQSGASIAVAENGTSVVVWTSNDGGGQTGVFAKYYDANMNALGGEFRVDVPLSGVTGDDASVAIDAVGNAVITWESVNAVGDSEILGRRFRYDGTAVGSVIDVSGIGDVALLESANAAVAMNDAGQFVVVWDTDDGTALDRSSVYGRTFHADGTAATAAFLIADMSGVDFTQPSVSINNNGDIGVGFTTQGLLGLIPSDVRAVSLDFAGNEVFVHATAGFVDHTDGDQYGTAVALTDGGQLSLAWEGAGLDRMGMDDSQEVYRAIVDFTDGQLLENQDTVSVNGNPQERQTDRFSPALTVHDGDTVATGFLKIEDNGDQSIGFNGLSGARLNTPNAESATLAIVEDQTYVFSTSDFGYSDPDGDPFTLVQIASTPRYGRILLDGVAVVAGQKVLASNIDAEMLTFQPPQDFVGVESFDFFVQDGVAYSTKFETIKFDVEEIQVVLGDSFTATSGSIPVHAPSLDDQSNPEITHLADGGYVVVWQTPDQDLLGDQDGDGNPDDGSQIYLQRFDKDNQPVGAAFVVGRGETGDQQAPKIAGLTDGGFVVVGASRDAITDEMSVFGQRFDEAGNVVDLDGTVDPSGTATFEIAEHTQFSQNFVSVSATDDGGFVASWSTLDPTLENNPSLAVVARVFAADGTAGSEFLLNETIAGGQGLAQVQQLDNGNLVASWIDFSDLSSRFRVFDSEGNALNGEQRSSTQPDHDTSTYDLTVLEGGRFLITWQEDDAALNHQVMGRIFESDGTAVTATDQLVSPGGSSFNVFPTSVSLGDGTFVVIWDRNASDNHFRGVVGQRFDADFNVIGDEFSINSNQYGTQGDPSATLLASGELAVAFVGPNVGQSATTSQNDIFVERLTPSTTVSEDLNAAIPLTIVPAGMMTGVEVTLTGLPVGSELSDGSVTVEVTSFGQVVDVTLAGMDLAALTVTPPSNFFGEIAIGVTYTAVEGAGTVGEAATRSLLLHVTPVNDAAMHSIDTFETAQDDELAISPAMLFVGSTDPDAPTFSPTAVVDLGFSLDPASPPALVASNYLWLSTSGVSQTIELDSTHVQFHQTAGTEFPGIRSAFAFDGSGGGDFATSVFAAGSATTEIWLKPSAANSSGTLIEMGDQTLGWGLYLNQGRVELHLVDQAGVGGPLATILISDVIPIDDFTQVVVVFDNDGTLSGNPTIPDLGLFVNGRQVDLSTDLPPAFAASAFSGLSTGSLARTSGGVAHATETSYVGFEGQIAEVNFFDTSIDRDEVQHRYLDVVHGAHVTLVEGQAVVPGLTVTLGTGATVTYQADGTLAYDPNGMFETLGAYDAGDPSTFATDSFEVTISDGQGDVQQESVEVLVKGTNDAPTLTIVTEPGGLTYDTPAGTLVGTAMGSDVDQNDTLTYQLATPNTGAFAVNATTGEITLGDIGAYRAPVGGGPHVIEVEVRDVGGLVDTASITIPVPVLPLVEVSGFVFEDRVGDGSVTGDVGAGSVLVHLYRDDGDQIREATDAYVMSVMTDSSGRYTFLGAGVVEGGHYVVVDSSTVTSANGLNSGYSIDDHWAEQTYASSGALYLDELGVEQLSTGGTLFGGYSGIESDDASTLLTAEHVTFVTATQTVAGSADFGFSFNVVTNTLDGDTTAGNRTIQGSLRQFIHNANAIDNSDPTDIDNDMRFVPRVAASSFDETWWQIEIATALPSITDSHTSIDGTVYALDGVSERDTNGRLIGNAMTVGTGADGVAGTADDLQLQPLNAPELEIFAATPTVPADRVQYGIVVEGTTDAPLVSDVVIRNVSIHGFGGEGSSDEGANIYVAGGGLDRTDDYRIDGLVIENALVGVDAAGVQPLMAAAVKSTGILIYRADNGTIQDSFVGYNGMSGIDFQNSVNVNLQSPASSGWTIERNRIANNALASVLRNGLSLHHVVNTTIHQNYIFANQGFGIDAYTADGPFQFSHNTIEDNGQGSLERGGIRLFGSGSSVTNNRVLGNDGYGIGVIGYSELGPYVSEAATDNLISRNEFHGNNGLAIDLIGSLTNGLTFDELDVGNGNFLSASEISGTQLALTEHDTDFDDLISRAEYRVASADQFQNGDGVGAVGLAAEAGNLGLEFPTLLSVTTFDDRFEFALQAAGLVDRIEFYTSNGTANDFGHGEGTVYLGTAFLVDATFDSVSGIYRGSVSLSGPITGSVTTLAFAGNNTSEFSNNVVVNLPPTAASNTVDTTEDTSLDLTDMNFGYSDVNDPDVSTATLLVRSVQGGTLMLDGSAVPNDSTVPGDRLNDLTFVPTSNLNGLGAGSITFAFQDPKSATTVDHTLTIDITADNDAPTAINDTVVTNEDTAIDLSHANFGYEDVEDGAGTSLGVIRLQAITGGTLTLEPAGTVVSDTAELSRNQLDQLRFTPTADRTDPGVIEFRAVDSDDLISVDTYTLTINITPFNDAPTAVSNTVDTTEDTSVGLTDANFGYDDVENPNVSTATLLVRSVQGGTLMLDGAAVPNNSTVAGDRLNDLIFTPASNLNGLGAGSVTFAFEDADSTTSVDHTLTFDVAADNDAPTGISTTVFTDEDTPLALSQANFGYEDVEDGADTTRGMIRLQAITGGTLTLEPAGTAVADTADLSRQQLDQLLFAPTADSTTSGVVEYRLVDSDGRLSDNSYALTIDILSFNDAPTAVSNTVDTLEDTSLDLTDANFGYDDAEDPNVSTATLLVRSVQGGTLMLDGAAVPNNSTVAGDRLNDLTFVPAGNLNGLGAGTITFAFEDPDSAASDDHTLTIDIAADNDAPIVAEFSSYLINEDSSVTINSSIGLLANASDVDGDDLDIVPTTVSATSFGTLSIDFETGAFTYTANPDAFGTETITYEVTDGTTTVPATLTIRVRSVNDAPEITAVAQVDLAENTRFVTILEGADIEDGSTSSFAIVGGGDASHFEIANGNRLYFSNPPNFESPADRSGNNIYRVRVATFDSNGQSSAAQLIQIRVNDVNEQPYVTNPTPRILLVETPDGYEGNRNLYNTVTDVDAFDNLTFSVVEQASYGEVVINADGTFVYLPNESSPDQFDSFRFLAIDSAGLQSGIVNVQLNVNSVFVSTVDATDDVDTSDSSDSSEPTGVVVVSGDENDDEEETIVVQLADSGGVSATNGETGRNDSAGQESDDLEVNLSNVFGDRTYVYQADLASANLLRQFSSVSTGGRAGESLDLEIETLASAFLEELNSSKKQYLFQRVEIGTPEMAASAATLLTMSYLIWNMGSGLLLSTFLSSLPAWSSFDILPVIAGAGVSGEDDESIEQMVDQ